MVSIDIDQVQFIGDIELLLLIVKHCALIIVDVITSFMVDLISIGLDIAMATLHIGLNIAHQLLVRASIIEPTLLVIYPLMLSSLKVTPILRSREI